MICIAIPILLIRHNLFHSKSYMYKIFKIGMFIFNCMQKDHVCNHFRIIMHIIGLKIHFLGCVLREGKCGDEKKEKSRALN